MKGKLKATKKEIKGKCNEGSAVAVLPPDPNKKN